ncbi:undecaprenyl/decaprenyl-phosphate alpha-N-acetylglucosaminyl 1-phosphate transferase [Candidatus Uhrbacteria bacterium]|nr:undecaprenyl/decaprenyl-phosphate alpha-N-acetylglucosaminyl 1-phosphate transferase [Candidatus Uhrbacteria bacterium]
MSLWWALPVLAALALAILATDAVRGLASRLGIVDAPNKERKIHDRAVPLAGGVAVYLAFTVPTLAVLLFSDHFTKGEMGAGEFAGLLVGGLILLVGGVLDDRYDLPPRATVWFPVAAALVATLAGIGVTKLTNPFADAPIVLAPAVTGVFTFLWLLTTTYTTKLLDGLDGLVGSIGLTATLVITGLALSTAFFQPDVALLAGIAAAALLGFLLWNWYPARIFLGEGGSTFVGFLVGVLAVISGGKVATALLVLGIPALDIVFVVIRRLRQGRNPFTSADREHLHHLLLRRGLSQRTVVLLYAGAAALFGVSTFLLTSWQKIVALAILGAAALLGVIRLSRTH